MRVGERRRLTLPPSMGYYVLEFLISNFLPLRIESQLHFDVCVDSYGSEGDGKKVPPNSWLVYEVELLKVRD